VVFFVLGDFMSHLDNERLNNASLKVVGETLPTDRNVFARLNELDPPQGVRIDRIARNLASRGMDPYAARNMALGVGLGILMAAEATDSSH
jgi:hypothetical protein